MPDTGVIEVGTEPVQSGEEISCLPSVYFTVTVPLTATEELIVTYSAALTGLESAKNKHKLKIVDLNIFGRMMEAYCIF